MTYFVASLDSAEYELWMIWFLYFPKFSDEFWLLNNNTFCGFWCLLNFGKFLGMFVNNSFWRSDDLKHFGLLWNVSR